ncbi:GTP cyclohydrolase 1 [Candidatus Photodesmus blepharus]|uniref:GTP cyclohydrolase 1 n=1 Tax=Candidatus Photodesmus blepharonis TaxID=1179155 RepID=A0A084CM93_9GAMM|nr:GTP cyclohydrolase I FolE [Candidatus Photodesmus blepharus]KEY90922.1 GTP cyclohydrolase 1 [Candidatus Photodesmus blepharus]
MLNLSESAKLVKDALERRGLETPISSKNKIGRKEKKERIEYHIRKILSILELNIIDDSLEKTPYRVAKMYVDEIFSGLNYQNFPKITIIENKMNVNEMICVKDITLTSTCEHHFVTIDGKAALAYIPRNKLIGLSKINRIVRFFAQRPQIQERMTQQILVALQVLLGSDDVAVSIKASHYCVKSRGVTDSTSQTITRALGGIFKSNSSTRCEFLDAIH